MNAHLRLSNYKKEANMDLYAIKLSWKSFKVHMPDAEAYFRMSAGQHYAGNSASVDDHPLVHQRALRRHQVGH